jgi:microcompartment protein CcmL/EutN
MNEPALGMIEYKSVARGIFSCDAMVKKAPVRIVETHAVCPGKYITIICGEVADVEEAMKAGLETGTDMVIADLFLPQVHWSVIPALAGASKIEKFGAVGIIETFSVADCVRAADIAAKATPVQLVEIRLANGLGGKGYFVMTGELADVEASLAEARQFVKEQGMLAACELIPAPHPDLIDKGMYW